MKKKASGEERASTAHEADARAAQRKMPAELARSRGVQQVHLSLSHDGPVATAFVILEGAA